MSTVPETILARHAGLRVLALSMITNMGCGLHDEPLSHAHTLASAQSAGARAVPLLHAIVEALDRDDMSQTIRTEADVARLALACLDLTSLNDGDRDADVIALCQRAAGAHGTPAAVCVWPHLARVAVQHAPRGVRVAAVANFPDGGTDLQRALADTGAHRAGGRARGRRGAALSCAARRR